MPSTFMTYPRGGRILPVERGRLRGAPSTVVLDTGYPWRPSAGCASPAIYGAQCAISAVTNKGELRWMVLEGAIKAAILIAFLARLIRDADCKVFLILDNLRVHRARLVRKWLPFDKLRRAHRADRGVLFTLLQPRTEPG
jgi:hypothetical protein